MLNARNIKTVRLSKSLNYKNLKSFKIVCVINNSAYKLKLLKFIKSVYLVFYL